MAGTIFLRGDTISKWMHLFGGGQRRYKFCTNCVSMMTTIDDYLKCWWNFDIEMEHTKVWLQQMFNFEKSSNKTNNLFDDSMPFLRNVIFQKSWNVLEMEPCRQLSWNVLGVCTPLSIFNFKHFCFLKLFRFIGQNFELLATFKYGMNIYLNFGYRNC